MPSALAATCPLITPSPEALTLNFSSPMKATGPVTGAPATKTPVASSPKLPSTPALVQVAEPCFTANPSVLTPVVRLIGSTARNPVDVTTKEKGLCPVGKPVPVQFAATVYVPVAEKVTITPSRDDVVVTENVPVVESKVIWLTAAEIGTA